jgi:hypothetical protein
MLGKLKDMASSGALDKVVGLLGPEMQQTLESIKQYNVSDLQDDEKYGVLVSKPALLTFTASAGGMTKMIPGFDDKFMRMMLHLRNELIDLSGDFPALQDGFQEKLPTALLDGLKA